MCNGSAIARRDSLCRRLARQKVGGLVSLCECTVVVAATSHYQHRHHSSSHSRDQHGCFGCSEKRRGEGTTSLSRGGQTRRCGTGEAEAASANVVIGCLATLQLRSGSGRSSAVLLLSWVAPASQNAAVFEAICLSVFKALPSRLVLAFSESALYRHSSGSTGALSTSTIIIIISLFSSVIVSERVSVWRAEHKKVTDVY